MKLRLKSSRKVKLVREKSLKKDFKIQYLSFSYQVKRIIFKVQCLKMTTLQVKRIAWFTLKKELRRSDFLYDGGYLGARAPLLSTSKIKKEIKVRVTQFHTILKIRLLSFETNVRGANTFLKRKYNSRTWNILYDRFPSVFPTFSTNKRWWRLRAFSSFGKHTHEPRLTRPQNVSLICDEELRPT